jgi:hypothetical protein
MRGTGGPESGPAFLDTLDALVTLCRAYPRLSHEVRALRGEAQRLRQSATLATADVRRLEGELAIARAKITGLERLHAA